MFWIYQQSSDWPAVHQVGQTRERWDGSRPDGKDKTRWKGSSLYGESLKQTGRGSATCQELKLSSKGSHHLVYGLIRPLVVLVGAFQKVSTISIYLSAFCSGAYCSVRSSGPRDSGSSGDRTESKAPGKAVKWLSADTW